MTTSVPAPPSATLTVFRLAALCTALAVAMGSVVCATGSGAACPTWPGCHPGQIAPQWELSPLIEFTHRVVAIATGPLVLAAAVMSLRVAAVDRWVRTLPWVALAGALAAGAFGRLVVLSGLPTWLGAVDLFSALTAMTVMTVAAVRLAPRPSVGWVPARVRGLATTTVGTVIALHVTGIFAAGSGSYTRCMGWPLWQLIGTDLHPWLQRLRLG
ncbi:MAG: COX15/CtaA family protein, partial [Kineosporiaceae bacterium]